MKYQILYKLNSKSSHTVMESDSFQNVKEVFNNLMVGEILEIREYLHEDKTIKKDDKNYIHSATFKISSSDKQYFNSFRVPKIKKNLEDTFLIQNVHNFIKLNNVNPDNVNLNVLFK